MSRTSPSSPPQQRWSSLFCLSVTEVVVNCPVVGFNNRQDWSVPKCPPQSRWPQWECRHLSSPGRSGNLQWLPEWGLYTSTLLPTAIGLPPVIRNPAIITVVLRKPSKPKIEIGVEFFINVGGENYSFQSLVKGPMKNLCIDWPTRDRYLLIFFTYLF